GAATTAASPCVSAIGTLNATKPAYVSSLSLHDALPISQGLNETLGDAFGFVETANQNYIGFIHRKDSLAWEKFQQAYMETVNDSISRFKTSQVLYNHFGDAFRAFTRPYLTVVDSIIVVANSAQTLRI